MLFRQLFEPQSSTYTYLVADSDSKEGLLIDPVVETIDRDLKLLQELEVNLKYIFETHLHADHITAASEIREHAGGQTGISKDAEVQCTDLQLEDEQEFQLGDHIIKVLSTPGHTSSCLSFFLEDRVFTGDALLIRGCGRTDFQGGSAQRLFSSVREKLFKLPDQTLVFPAHDYQGRTCSSIKEEKQFNPRLKEEISAKEFETIMKNLQLPHPKMMDQALPANRLCGKLPE